MQALTGELLGNDASVDGLAATIVLRVGGNPFFAEEIVRDLAERGVLERASRRSMYADRRRRDKRAPTLHATIDARIDRLPRKAKRALCAAAVIGSRFDTELLSTLGVEPVLDDLVKADLIDQVRFTPQAEYAFRHPLIRSVAYESQLRSDRAELHRRLATTIQERDPESVDKNAALIAEHLEAAGDARCAYAWHMRAGPWLTNRDIAAAWASWERARQIADALPDVDPDRTAMRIAPRAMLCATALRGTGVHFPVDIASQFEELRELCALAEDKTSLAFGMIGMASDYMFRGRLRDASRSASDRPALLESTGDPTETVGAASIAMSIKYETGDMADILRWSQAVINAAGGDPGKGTRAEGNLIVASPLPVALVWRGIARCCRGRPGWREDFDDAVAMARRTDPATYSAVVQWKHRFAIPNGVLRVEDRAVRELEEAVHIAQELRADTSLNSVKRALGVVLTYRNDAADSSARARAAGGGSRAVRE